MSTLLVAVFTLRCSIAPVVSVPAADDAGTGLDAGNGGEGSIVASGVVTPSAGGVVRTSDGRVTIEVPPGAVSAETTVTIRSVADDPADALLVPGSTYELGPDGITFDVPVTLTIAYDAARIPAGVEEAELRIAKRVEAGWSEVAGSTVDTAAHVARAELGGFSTYGVRARSASSIADASTDGPPDADAGVPKGELVAVDPEDYPISRVLVDDQHVYWTSFTTIRRAPIAGGATESLASVTISDALMGEGSQIYGLTKVGSMLFVTTGRGQIVSVPAAGGPPKVHAANGAGSMGLGLVTDGSFVYWAGGWFDVAKIEDAGTVRREDLITVQRTSATTSSCVERIIPDVSCRPDVCPEGGYLPDPAVQIGVGPMCTEVGSDVHATCCAPFEDFAFMSGELAPDERSVGRRLTLADGYVYWTENANVRAWVLRKAVAGGPIEVVATEAVSFVGGVHPFTYDHLAVGAGRVYWVRRPDGKKASIVSAPITGGTPTVVVADLAPYARYASGVRGLAADDTHVYFTPNSGGGVFRFAHGGGTVVRIADAPDPGEVALTETHVYWGERGATTSIRRLPK